MTCNGRWPSEFRYIQQWCTRSINPKMEVYEESNKDMKWSYENISTCSSDWPKEWPFSVKSNSINVIEALQWRRVTLKPSWGSFDAQVWWIDTHPLEMKIETNYGFKRWPSAKSKPRCATSEPKDLDATPYFLCTFFYETQNSWLVYLRWTKNFWVCMSAWLL
jgi:hypothetical protein